MAPPRSEYDNYSTGSSVWRRILLNLRLDAVRDTTLPRAAPS
jgi:hypothetical protein